MALRPINPASILGKKDITMILDTLWANGFSAHVVGGAVRDALLGLDPGDVDILTHADPSAVAALFPRQKTRYVGKSFAITLVNHVEVASCRGQGGGWDDLLASDLGMRDFTVNSMAWDPNGDRLADPYGGCRDLQGGIIRFTRNPHDRILEDPLRMVRACRFAARYGFSIAGDSLAAIKKHKELIGSGVPGERIRTEVLKAMAMDRPSRFFTLLQETGLLASVFPSLDRCWGQDGGPFHDETVFEHCLLVGDALPARQPLLRLAGFLHDTGKIDAARIKNGRLTFAGHEKEEAALAQDLSRLRFSNREAQYILSLVRAHMRPLNDESTPRAVRRLLAMLDDLDLSYRDFLRLRIADKKGNRAKKPYTFGQIRARLKKIRDEISAQAAFNINDLNISGREIQAILGLAQGPVVGQVKADLFEQVLENPKLNTRDALVRLVVQMGEKLP